MGLDVAGVVGASVDEGGEEEVHFEGKGGSWRLGVGGLGPFKLEKGEGTECVEGPNTGQEKMVFSNRSKISSPAVTH